MNAYGRRQERRRQGLKREIRFVHRPAWLAATTDDERLAWRRRYGAMAHLMPETWEYMGLGACDWCHEVSDADYLTSNSDENTIPGTLGGGESICESCRDGAS